MKIIPIYCPHRWQIVDVTDSISACISPEITNQFTNEIREIRIAYFSLPTTVENFEAIMEKCFFNHVIFKDFLIHQDEITCTFQFMDFKQPLTMYTFPQISADMQANIKNRLKSLIFSYELTHAYIFFHVPDYNLNFKWNAAWGKFTSEGNTYYHFLKSVNFTPLTQTPDSSTNTSNPVESSVSSSLAAAPANTFSQLQQSPAPTHQPQVQQPSAQVVPTCANCSGGPEPRLAKANMSLLAVYMKDMTFDASDFAQKVIFKKGLKVPDMINLMLALNGCLKVADPNVPESAVAETPVIEQESEETDYYIVTSNFMK